MPEASLGLPLKNEHMTKRSLDNLIHNSGADQLAISTRPDPDPPTTSLLAVTDTEPQCLLHHEYAEILHRGHDDSDPLVRSFINRHGEIRHYVCLPCRSCPPGVRILSPCHRRRDTICSSTCVEPNYQFDMDRQMCIPQDPAQDTSTQASSSTAILLPRTTANNLVFVVDDSTGDSGIIDTVDQFTAPPPSHKALGTQVTVITVGIVTLNMLAIAGIALIYKRAKCRKRYQKSRSGCFNNVLSTPHDATQSSVQSSSVHNQVDNRPNTTSDSSSDRSTSRGIQGETSLSDRRQPQSEPSSQRAKESNLNIFREPGYEQGAVTIMVSQENESVSPAPIQVLRGKDPYWLVMIGQFGPEGGVLSCEDSDVILEIPPGAIPADHQNQTIIAKVSLRPDVAGPKKKDPDSLWLTPLVEFESPGLKRFNKDVRMRLPHCARMKPGWTFCVNYTNPAADTKCKRLTEPATSNRHPEADSFLLSSDAKSESTWFSVEQKCILTKSGKSCRKASVEGDDVTFTVDEKYFNVSTSHFSKYCCTGCHKEHPLHLEAVVYWIHTKVQGREQMDLNVYILDPIKDARVRVDQNERYSDSHTGYYDLILGYKKKSKEPSPIEISVPEDCMGDDWKWKLDTYNGCLPAKKVIPIQSLIRCCSPLMFSRQTFSFSPKNPAKDKQLSFFKAIVCIKQENWPEGDPTNILVTVPLAAKETIESYLNVNNNRETGAIVTDAQIKLVESKLSVKNWRPLYRKLTGEGADVKLGHIEARHPNNTAEQIHEALVDWRTSAGPMARLQDLIVALEEVGHRDIVDSLQPVMKMNDELIVQSDEPSMCKKETCV
ncbi:uncharacterized protein LOC119746419 isoform X2 [Patiria miniata]|nr:uncharacterized protein LOC119746419 isoform X2 [Patiria miniata]